MISQFCAADMNNYGDLLYPVILQEILKVCGQTVEDQKFSFSPCVSLQNSGYATKPIRSLFFSNGSQQLNAQEKHNLVIGGGDVLRTDWDVVAGHYYNSDSFEKGKNLLSLSVQYLLPKRISRKISTRRRNNFIRQFRTRYMNYPAIGPFIINPSKLPDVDCIAYCSCGVPFDFSKDTKNQIAQTFEQANFIYVRDQQSKDKLLRAGVEKEVYAAPDLIVTLSDFFDYSSEISKGHKILQRFGVNIDRPILCFQSFPQSEADQLETLKQLIQYQERTGYEVVLLPIGRCHSDGQYLTELSKESGEKLKYINIDSIFDVISVIAASSTFLGTSMHGNITAFSFGIPHLFAPIQVDKAEGFLDIVNLPLDLKLKSWSEINDKLDMLSGFESNYFVDRASVAKEKVYEVTNLLVEALQI